MVMLVPFTAHSNVKIEHGIDDDYNGITCSKPSLQKARHFKSELKLFLKKYKQAVISRNLTKVVACKKLTRGHYNWYRGTYVISQNTIYVEIGGNIDDTEYLLHHEFSSLLLHAHPHKAQKMKIKWISWSNKNYNLDHNKRDWILKKSLQKNGFLYEYNKVSFENDFNVLSAFYMSFYLRHKLTRARQKHWRLQKKYEMLHKFYQPLIDI